MCNSFEEKWPPFEKKQLNNAISQQVNFADGTLPALNLLQTDDFVQCAVSDKGAPPTIIPSEQSRMAKIQWLCCNHSEG
jgi:hypothetical protein